MDVVDEVRSWLESIDGPVSRQLAIDHRKKLESELPSHLSAPPSPSATSDERRVEMNEEHALALAPSQRAASLPVEGGQLTPSKSKASILLIDLRGVADTARLSKWYVPGGEPQCLSITNQISKNATVIVIARVSHLSIAAAKLSYWQQSKFGAYFLLQRPTETDVTSAVAIAVTRNDDRLVSCLKAWSERDPLEICRAAFESEAARKIHLFAETDAPGWETVIGEANWIMERVTDAPADD